MATKKKSAPLKWKAGVKHPTTGKVVGGRIMSKAERAVFRSDGKLRKGKRKADYAKAKRATTSRKKATTRRKTSRRRSVKRTTTRRRNPGTSKVKASSVKIAQTRKTAPGGWKSSMGPYVIVTSKGNMVKGKSFRDLNAAKTALAALRSKGRKGLKLVKVSITKKRNPSSSRKATTRRRTVTRRRRNARRRRNKKSRTGTVSKKQLRGMMKRLGL